MLRFFVPVLLVCGATPALADRNAPPPASGEVVHLFGPQGVWANLAPLTGTTPPAAAPAPTATAATAAQTPSPNPTQAAYPEPTLGAVLHQMFVTGDPNAGPGFAQGRKGN